MNREHKAIKKEIWRERTEVFNESRREEGYQGKNRSIRYVKKMVGKTGKWIRRVELTNSKEAFQCALHDTDYMLILISEVKRKRACK